jgi:hypothetical protein
MSLLERFRRWRRRRAERRDAIAAEVERLDAEEKPDPPPEDAAQNVFDAGLGTGFTQDPEP